MGKGDPVSDMGREEGWRQGGRRKRVAYSFQRIMSRSSGFVRWGGEREVRRGGSAVKIFWSREEREEPVWVEALETEALEAESSERRVG